MWSKNSFLERGTAFEKTVRLNSREASPKMLQKRHFLWHFWTGTHNL